jgi:NAD(P)-dependent dehydrogenase (short-subunit alcohol dehydrogenase family)
MLMNDEMKRVPHLFDLKEKVAIVTGGAGALGRTVSAGLAASGVDIAVCDLNEPALGEICKEIEKTGRRALPIRCDITNPDDVERMVARAAEEFGRLDILFNGAGIAHRELSVEMPIQDWQKVMDVNLKGSLLCSRSAAKVMIRGGRPGSIILVGSVRGFQAHGGGYSAYGTSKAAVHYLTKQLAFEWAGYRIRVNCIAPCVFWSPLTQPILNDPESYKSYVSRIPIGRAAKPFDFVGPTIFLASDASEMVTAHILSVDGGAAGG